MSISPRNTPPGPLSTRNQPGRSERADGSGMRAASRGNADTPALAISRSKAQQEDVGRNDSRVRTGITSNQGAMTPLAQPVGGPVMPTVRPVGTGGPAGSPLNQSLGRGRGPAVGRPGPRQEG